MLKGGIKERNSTHSGPNFSSFYSFQVGKVGFVEGKSEVVGASGHYFVEMYLQDVRLMYCIVSCSAQIFVYCKKCAIPVKFKLFAKQPKNKQQKIKTLSKIMFKVMLPDMDSYDQHLIA